MKAHATPPPGELTERQHEIREFIRDWTRRHGYGPSMDDIRAAFGIASRNGVACHLKALRKKGRIAWTKGLSRTITLVGDDPDDLLPLLSSVLSRVARAPLTRFDDPLPFVVRLSAEEVARLGRVARGEVGA